MTESRLIPEGVETDRPSVARLYDYLLGGQHNFAADRDFARKVLQTEPNARLIVTENRKFLGRAVRFLLSAGIRQFIDLGSGIPTQENVHQIAQRGDPGARVIYVDHDPVAVAHSKQLLTGNTLARVIHADLRDPGGILEHPDVTALIDFSEPVGLLMVSVLHFIVDSDDLAGILARYQSRLVPGSALTISHATYEAAPGVAAQVQDLYQSTTASSQFRTHAEIMRLFTGFELVEPGLVYLALWRPDDVPPDRPERAWFYAGVGRKPG
jgi:hypothetical protein